MPRNAARFGPWKHHRPCDSRGLAPQFRIDEVGEASEKQPDRRRGGHHVEYREQRRCVLPGKIQHRQRRPYEPAMKRHSAFPDAENFDRMRGIKRKIIKQHITQPPAEHDAQGHVEQQIIGFLDCKRGSPSWPQPHVRDHALHIRPAQQQPAGVRQSIPFHGNRAERQRNGIQVRKWQRQQWHGAGPVENKWLRTVGQLAGMLQRGQCRLI